MIHPRRSGGLNRAMPTYLVPGTPYAIDDNLKICRATTGYPAKMEASGRVRLTIDGKVLTYDPGDILALARDGVPLPSTLIGQGYQIPDTIHSINDDLVVWHTASGKVTGNDDLCWVKIIYQGARKRFNRIDLLNLARDGVPLPSVREKAERPVKDTKPATIKFLKTKIKVKRKPEPTGEAPKPIKVVAKSNVPPTPAKPSLEVRDRYAECPTLDVDKMARLRALRESRG